MTQCSIFVPLWTLILGARRLSSTCCSTASISASASSTASRRTPASRNLVMNSIAPIWDGNETWLVLGGLGLLAAFPLAFAIIIPAVYFPILVMLLALVFRGVAFEFRFRDAEHRTFWDHGFCYGSARRDLRAGHRARRLHPGLPGRRPRVRRHSLRFPDAVLGPDRHCTVFGYGLLGAGWLVLKTEGEVQERARRYGRVCLAGSSSPSASSASGRR